MVEVNLGDYTVIKIGGNEIDNPAFLEQLVEIVASMTPPPIIVHGGGKEVTELQEQLGINCERIEGLRVTDAHSLRVTEMVLSGLVNKRLVRMLVMAGMPAIGLSGVDAHLFQAEKLCIEAGDLGFVGKVVKVNAPALEKLVGAGFLPVISPMSLSEEGQVYNVNADAAAQALAEGLKVGKLIFITDVPGVRIAGEFRDVLAVDEIEPNIDSGEISGGMIPKVRAAVDAIQNGVGAVVITNAANFTTGTGTKITI
ncbi:MAG TPA: acetylglutamate kinase [Candidatus Lokiarchaeia archaeon]|nr:acetylglutamate kinase [Candidatus Lokiarchaeia archaeon]